MFWNYKCKICKRVFIVIMNIFLNFQGQTSVVSSEQLKTLLYYNQQTQSDLYFISEKRVCTSQSMFQNNQTVYALIKMYGGKGGFGAKLKTQGGKKVRPNENMFSRDLQGQPIAYATITRQYQEYYRKKTIQNQKVQKQLEEFKVVSHTYREDYVSTKLDSTYNAQMQQNQKRLQDAMKIGIKKYLEKKKQAHKKQQEGEMKKNQKNENNQEQQGIQVWKDCQQKKCQKNIESQVQKQHLQKDETEKSSEKKLLLQQPIKRSRPVENKQQKIEQKLPSKHIKLNSQNEIKKSLQNTTTSAREKLKSLFKK